MNKRQRKKQLKQQQQLQQVKQQEVLEQLGLPSRKKARGKKERRRAIEKIALPTFSSTSASDPIGDFIRRKRDILVREVKRFDKLIDAYVDEQVAIRKEIIRKERERVLDIELPAYVDYVQEMNKLGYNLRNGELKVVPDLDFMANEYMQGWSRSLEQVVISSGFREKGLRKMLERMAFSIWELAVDTFVENQHEDPRNILARCYKLIEQSIAEHGEQYDRQKKEVYAFENKPGATGQRPKA